MTNRLKKAITSAKKFVDSNPDCGLSLFEVAVLSLISPTHDVKADPVETMENHRFDDALRAFDRPFSVKALAAEEVRLRTGRCGEVTLPDIKRAGAYARSQGYTSRKLNGRFVFDPKDEPCISPPFKRQV